MAILELPHDLFSHLLHFSQRVEGDHVLSRAVVLIFHEQEHSSYPIRHFDELYLVDVLLKVELELMFEDVRDDQALFLKARQHEKRTLV